MDSLNDAAVAVDASTSNTPPGCKPGTYRGKFDGTLQVAEVPVSTVEGRVTAELVLDDSGDYLNMRGLRVSGRDASGNTLRVTMSGKINCRTLELEDGQLDNGRYFQVARRNTLNFDGVVQGAYTVNPYAVHGTWSVSARAATLLSGDGVFSFALDE